MAPYKPLLGSAAIEAPMTQTVRVTEPTCRHLREACFGGVIANEIAWDDVSTAHPYSKSLLT